jgi:quercetin 2,3-dioxygenase
MSGPVGVEDTGAAADEDLAGATSVELTESREAHVGAFRVRRALPRRGRRTVGAWCFVDHMGPTSVSPQTGPDVAPHPHIGLQTVTWLLSGEIVHRDSLGSEQNIRPGQLNLMTAGGGVAHSEERSDHFKGDLHGVQLWVAQPSATRAGPAQFQHHSDLPQVDLGEGSVATVIVGDHGTTSSPARRDTDHVGVDLDLRAPVTDIELRSDFEHAVVVFDGSVLVDETVIEPGHLAYLHIGRDELRLEAREPARALLIGGTPFDEQIVMWWNFVARTQDELYRAYRDWTHRSDRFGPVDSQLAPVDVGPPPWAED